MDDKIAEAVAAERERCSAIADAQTIADQRRFGKEKDWSLPYALNRVLRASMDIAAEIRKGADQS
jgi:hypothetical protein